MKVRGEKLGKKDRSREASSIEEGISGAKEGECLAEGFLPLIAEVPPFRYAQACKEGPVFDARKIFWE